MARQLILPGRSTTGETPQWPEGECSLCQRGCCAAAEKAQHVKCQGLAWPDSLTRGCDQRTRVWQLAVEAAGAEEKCESVCDAGPWSCGVLET